MFKGGVHYGTLEFRLYGLRLCVWLQYSSSLKVHIGASRVYYGCNVSLKLLSNSFFNVPKSAKQFRSFESNVRVPCQSFIKVES